jgi:hypothetical protein
VIIALNWNPLPNALRSGFRGLWIAGALVALCSSARAQSSATFGWKASASPETVGYNIYYGQSSRAYTSKLAFGDVTQATISGLTGGVTYYFAATSYDSAGVESSYSPEIVYTVPPTPPANGLTFSADAGTISTPFVVSDGAISQAVATDVSTGGRASYNFNVPVAGNYTVAAVVSAPNDSANSFFVNIDAEPTDPTMIWDVPVAAGFVSQTVSWRGSGTYDNNEFSPKVFALSAGGHQLVIGGREPDCYLKSLSVVPLVPLPPIAPTISLSSPGDGQAYTAPASIALAADVIANGHNITRVQFYNGSTLLGESASAPYALAWDNVGAGTYALSAVAVDDTGSVFASGTSTVTVANPAPPANGLTFSADAGTISSPFVLSDGAISQAVTTGISDGGRAVYDFNVPVAGNYTVAAVVSASDATGNSFFVNIDAEPTDPAMIWDIPVTAGFVSQTVSWRGSGTSDNDEYSPKVFALSAGMHQLVIRGREAGTYLKSVTLSSVVPGALTFPADSGTISAPFQVSNGALFQTTTTGAATGGRAVYYLNVPVAGSYMISGEVSAPDDNANSFFVNIDAEPTDPTMIWDIPVTAGFVSQAVSWRGSGTYDNNEFSLKVFELSAGMHQLVIRGREAGTYLKSITISPVSAAELTFPADSGTISAPFQVSAGAIYQTLATGIATGGRAVYSFSVAVAGNYTVAGVVSAPDDNANSFFVNIDAEPTDPETIWDIPVAPGFVTQTVSWRGNGTYDNNQYSPKVFALSAGSHQLVIRGREPNTMLSTITVAPAPSGP